MKRKIDLGKFIVYAIYMTPVIIAFILVLDGLGVIDFGKNNREAHERGYQEGYAAAQEEQGDLWEKYYHEGYDEGYHEGYGDGIAANQAGNAFVVDDNYLKIYYEGYNDGYNHALQEAAP